MEFIKFPSIEGFHNVIKSFRPRIDQEDFCMMYCAKIKLHGTNASIQFDRQGDTWTIAAGKRTGFITPEDDNAGFAAWVHHNKEWLIDCNAVNADDPDLASFIIYGEWVGPGIQKGTALSELPHKVFCPFMGSYVNGPTSVENITFTYSTIQHFIREKEDIKILKPIDIEGLGSDESYEHFKFVDLPKYDNIAGMFISVDFMDREQQVTFAAYINAMVDQIDKECPWAKQHFGVSGPGEGLVFYPWRSHGTQEGLYMFERGAFSRWAFKAKGEKHQVVRNKAPVILDPEVVKARSEFVEKFVTPGRLEQGYAFIAMSEAAQPTMSDMSKFLKWMGNDILKECTAELEASGKDWKHFSGEITKACATWFKRKMLEI